MYRVRITDFFSYYDLQGRRFDNMKKGIKIIRRDNKTVKVSVK